MNIDSYFLRQSDSMPRKKNQAPDDVEHNQRASEAQAGASIIADTTAETSLRALREAVGEITANISKVIDNKLGPLSELLKIHREELDSHGKRITEAEQRISALEDAADPVDRKLEALEKMRPRSVLVRFHNYQDKQRVMNVAWEMGRKNEALKYVDATVMIFQDFSASVLRRRRGYDGVKKQLRALGADYRQVYPASLRVTCRGSTKMFHDPATVEKYVQSLKDAPRD
ncbi:hypothetical protein JOB18_030569 [Solea senegalensis]|uniref:Uncharacterized protein n=1 Tax=Solea senegalensis TaxID=28829 RepID=A0AAV6PSG3_SOLSE|nr:hypothetical protein JOB18_030569 [Solea senegalensis]